MVAIPLVALLMFPALQQPVPQPSDSAMQGMMEGSQKRYEANRLAAIHLNALADSIHSEADARAFVDAVAQYLTDSEYASWMTWSIRRQVAHAEYEAVSDPTRLIPEQHIVDTWNEYVREIGAPDETVITVAELHNLRDATYTISKLMWKKQTFPQSLWTMPGVYAVDADGKVATGSRAVEALMLLHNMFYTFQNVRSARERVQKGVLISESIKLRQQQETTPRPPTVRAQTGVVQNGMPIWVAARHYLEAHSERDYQRLLERLLAELFPPD